MKLYNVTFNESDMNNELKPTIPDSTGDLENKTIKRVCLSDSIEHCIQAIAPCNRNMRVRNILNVRVTSTERIGTNNIITPKELFNKGYVPDALENNEYWSLVPVRFNLEKHKIVSFDSEYDLGWTVVKLDKLQSIIAGCTKGIINIPDKITYSSESSQALHKNVLDYIYSSDIPWDEKYKLEDAIWDELVEIPYAQQIKIHSLQLEKIT